MLKMNFKMTHLRNLFCKQGKKKEEGYICDGWSLQQFFAGIHSITDRAGFGFTDFMSV